MRATVYAECSHNVVDTGGDNVCVKRGLVEDGSNMGRSGGDVITMKQNGEAIKRNLCRTCACAHGHMYTFHIIPEMGP